MKKIEWFLLVSSAILYALAFLFVESFWFLVFVFPILLFYVLCRKNLSFIHGYTWAFVAFSLHLLGGIYVVTCMACEAWLIGFLLSIAVVLYQSFVVALFFLFANRVVVFFSLQEIPLRLLIWVITLTGITTWIDQYSLSIFSISEGYPLMHPLIPLAQYPELLLFLPIVGKLLLTFLFLLTSASIALFMYRKNRCTFLGMIIIWMPWAWSWFYVANKVQEPEWLGQICTVSYMMCSNINYPSSLIRSVGMKLKDVLKLYPTITTIIMPESALNCTALLENGELMHWWNEQYIGEKIDYIFGTFRFSDDKYYNTACWVNNGILQKFCDKQHAVLISERLSPIINCGWLRDIYFKDQKEITIARNNREMFMVSDEQLYVPYICSELFFNEYPDDCYENAIILALVNDLSFASRYACYIHRLLMLLARFKAIQWQRPILYVSYIYSIFIDTHGRVFTVRKF